LRSEAADEIAREGAALVGEPEEGPCALATARGEPRLDEEF
jgi:hypothetical protein